MTGKLIFIEGPDGVGKTTTVENLKEKLELRTEPYEFLSFRAKQRGRSETSSTRSTMTR